MQKLVVPSDCPWSPAIYKSGHRLGFGYSYMVSMQGQFQGSVWQNQTPRSAWQLGLISRVCPGQPKLMRRSQWTVQGTTIGGGKGVGADCRQCVRLCMQDDKANFRPRSLHFVILNNIMEISADQQLFNTVTPGLLRHWLFPLQLYSILLLRDRCTGSLIINLCNVIKYTKYVIHLRIFII